MKFDGSDEFVDSFDESHRVQVVVVLPRRTAVAGEIQRDGVLRRCHVARYRVPLSLRVDSLRDGFRDGQV